VYRCIFKSSSTHNALGGAVTIQSENFLIEGSQFNGNSATLTDYDAYGNAKGGAIYATGNGDINRCLFANNYADAMSKEFSTNYSVVSASGGAIRVEQSNVSINNSLLYNNWVSAESYKKDYPTGAVLSSDTTLVLRNCTIAGVTKGDNAISSIINAYNTIFAVSGVPIAGAVKAECTIYNSVFTSDIDFIGVNGNVEVDPLFVDSANGNYSLQATSTLINSGDNANIYGNVDIDGTLRVLDTKVDIGAFEFGSSTLDIADDKNAETLQDKAITISLS